MFKFDENGKFMNFMGRLADLTLLNLLWLLCCLPVITVGASTVAACSILLKMVDDEEGPVVRSFFKAFRENFARGTVLWIFDAAILYALWIDWQLVTKVENPPLLLVIGGILTAVFAFCASVYSWPLVARYENKLLNTIRNSLRICTRYIFRTALIAALLVFEIFIFSWNLPMLVVGVIVAPMIMLFTLCGISKKIFEEIEKKGGVRGADGK